MENLSLNEYQVAAIATAIYPRQGGIIYPVLGLVGESGEIAEKTKKIIRDKQGKMDSGDSLEIAKEIGDVLWYIANLASDLGYTLEDVAIMNIDKLKSRKDRDVLKGSGDNR